MAQVLDRFCDSYIICRVCGEGIWHRFFKEDGTAECVKCGLREISRESHSISDAFYKANVKERLTTTCSECGTHLERKGVSANDIAGRCRNYECNPLPTKDSRLCRWDLRCPECGSWKLVGHQVMRCGNCDWVGYDKKSSNPPAGYSYKWNRRYI